MDERLRNSLVSESASLADAMWALERGGAEITLVVDDAFRLVGTLTDGDVRRALLKGESLASPLAPHLQRSFTWVSPDAGRAEVLDLMRARTIGQIPILDEGRRVVGLHLLHRLIGASERPNWAVVMAGGRGMRLRPMTNEVPKPLVRVAGRPILERIVLHLVGNGVRRVFLAINYLGHLIEQHFGDGAQFGCRIEYLRETEPLGSGGALSLLPEKPEHPLLVMNGDLVTQADLGALLDFHQRGGQDATLAVTRYIHQVPFGCVEVVGDRVVGLEEKPHLERLVNAGIYALEPRLIDQVPRVHFDMPTLLRQCIENNGRVCPFEVYEDWLDVGERDQLLRAREGGAR